MKINKNKICAHCHQIIVGVGIQYRGKLYCSYKCIEQVAQNNQQQEQDLQDFCNYLKKRFDKKDIPVNIVESITNKLNSDSGDKLMTLYGMKQTIEYYFNNSGDNSKKDLRFIGWILTNFYEEALEFYQKQNEIIEKNKKININIPPVRIKLNKRILDKKQKMGYNIEDL